MCGCVRCALCAARCFFSSPVTLWFFGWRKENGMQTIKFMRLVIAVTNPRRLIYSHCFNALSAEPVLAANCCAFAFYCRTRIICLALQLHIICSVAKRFRVHFTPSRPSFLREPYGRSKLWIFMRHFIHDGNMLCQTPTADAAYCCSRAENRWNGKRVETFPLVFPVLYIFKMKCHSSRLVRVWLSAMEHMAKVCRTHDAHVRDA